MSDTSPATRHTERSDNVRDGGASKARQSRGFGNRPSPPPMPPPLPSASQAKHQPINTPVENRRPWPLDARPSAHRGRLTQGATDTIAAPPSAHEEPNHVDPNHVSSRRRGSGAFGAFGYTAIGFIAGAAFWHAIGFWTLVHDAVFSGPRMQASTQRPQYANRPPVVRAFDEEVLRYANDPETRLSPSRIVTGSIKKPVAAPQPRPAKSQQAADFNTQVLKIEPEISWQPAVKKAASAQ